MIASHNFKVFPKNSPEDIFCSSSISGNVAVVTYCEYDSVSIYVDGEEADVIYDHSFRYTLTPDEVNDYNLAFADNGMHYISDVLPSLKLRAMRNITRHHPCIVF